MTTKFKAASFFHKLPFISSDIQKNQQLCWVLSDYPYTTRQLYKLSKKKNYAQKKERKKKCKVCTGRPLPWSILPSENHCDTAQAAVASNVTAFFCSFSVAPHNWCQTVCVEQLQRWTLKLLKRKTRATNPCFSLEPHHQAQPITTHDTRQKKSQNTLSNNHDSKCDDIMFFKPYEI